VGWFFKPFEQRVVDWLTAVGMLNLSSFLASLSTFLQFCHALASWAFGA
jgi:hypothetical protein